LTTPEELELYDKREHSLVKHLFLTQYLQAAAFKTLQGRSKIFNYVDAFAGPWNVSDDSDYSDASFERALRMLEKVRSTLGRAGAAGLKIRFCLCEKRPDAVARLKEYAAKKTGYEIYIFSGRFEENLDAIAKVIPDGFTFSFIDPKGWDVRNQEIFHFLRERKGDFLLNFMSDHINRHATYSQVVESFGRFLADPDWANDYSELPSYLTNEEKVLWLLKLKMKAARVAIFTPDFPIKLARSERIKMRLVLGTHSEKGLEVFRDVEAKIHVQQTEVRDLVSKKGDLQSNLFSAQEHASSLSARDGVGGISNLKLAESLILETLGKGVSIDFRKLALKLMEEVPIRLTQLRDLLGDLKSKGLVQFELPRPKKKPQDDTLISISNSSK
jgi:three-Cys-motif partner protein